MKDITKSTAYRILGMETDGKNFQQKLQALPEQDYETLIGICARLLFVDEIDRTRVSGNSLEEKYVLSYQTERLVTYLTLTCIDSIIGARYQPFNDWVNENYKSGGLEQNTNWREAVQNLTDSNDVGKTAKLLKRWIHKIYDEDYLETAGHKRFLRRFITYQHDWIKEWICLQYHINYSAELEKPNWDSLSQETKLGRIIDYLSHVRNLYTHTVIPYNPLNLSQSSPQKGLSGATAIYIPMNIAKEGSSEDESEQQNEYMEVMLPFEFRESDIVHLLVVFWIRKHWLKLEDRDNFLEPFWKSRRSKTS